MANDLLHDGKIIAACITALVALILAAGSGAWAVWVRTQENRRAKWRRIEELMQIIHNGATRGLWAQKLAVVELIAVAGNDKLVISVLTEAAIFSKATGLTDLGYYIDNHLSRS